MIRLSLPYPVSANAYWRSFVPPGARHVVVKPSKEARAYKTEVGWLAKAQGVGSPSRLDVSLVVRLRPREKNRDGSRASDVLDLDNCLKVAIDALRGIVYEDDAQVKRILAEYGDPLPRGGLEVEIARFEPPL